MVSVPDDITYETVDAQAVLLRLSAGAYLMLNPLGTRTFELLARSGHIDDTRTTLEAEYGADPVVLGADLDRLVDELVEHDLLSRA